MRHVRHSGKDFGEPGLRVDVVEFGGHNQGEHEGGSFGAAVRSGEEPCRSAKGNTAQGAFGGIVGQANPAIVKE